MSTIRHCGAVWQLSRFHEFAVQAYREDVLARAMIASVAEALAAQAVPTKVNAVAARARHQVVASGLASARAAVCLLPIGDPALFSH
jgi:hypothetical protein